MTKKQKTIKVEDIKTNINSFMKNSTDDKKQARLSIGLILEEILHKTNNYNGFMYLTQKEMKSSFEGTTFGINQDRPQKDWFKDTDHSRIKYF